MGKSKIFFLILVLMIPAVLSALTLGNMTDKVRLAIGEPDSTKSYFTNSELRSYINDGIAYAEGYGLGVPKRSKTALASEDETYDLPTDYVNWLSVWIKTTDSLIALDYTEQDLICQRWEGGWENAEYPNEFTIYGDSEIVVCPYPINTIDTLVVNYTARPSNLSAVGDTCVLIENLQYVVIQYAVAQCYLKDANLEAYFKMMEYVQSQLSLYEAKTYGRKLIPTEKPALEEQ